MAGKTKVAREKEKEPRYFYYYSRLTDSDLNRNWRPLRKNIVKFFKINPKTFDEEWKTAEIIVLNPVLLKGELLDIERHISDEISESDIRFAARMYGKWIRVGRPGPLKEYLPEEKVALT